MASVYPSSRPGETVLRLCLILQKLSRQPDGGVGGQDAEPCRLVGPQELIGFAPAINRLLGPLVCLWISTSISSNPPSLRDGQSRWTIGHGLEKALAEEGGFNTLYPRDKPVRRTISRLFEK
jgi:hypothetical protein